jgi:hypothetical protein
MFISEFLRDDGPHDGHHETLGIPTVPSEITRTNLLLYRATLAKYLSALDEFPYIRSIRYSDRRRSATKLVTYGARMKKLNRFVNLDYPDTVFVSDTKLKKAMKFRDKQRGKPFSQQEETRAYEASTENKRRRDIVKRLLEEIDFRIKNLPSAKPESRKGKPIIPPEIDDFL